MVGDVRLRGCCSLVANDLIFCSIRYSRAGNLCECWPMKGDNSSSWAPRNETASPQSIPASHQHQTSSGHQLREPSALSSRSLLPKSNTFSASFRSVFQRQPSRVPSSNSLRSSHSAASSSHNPASYPSADPRFSHPYAVMVAAPLPVVSSHDATDDEDECPVCLEPLSFSFRLPGEKPHIVPECGHALHEVSESVLLFSHSV